MRQYSPERSSSGVPSSSRRTRSQSGPGTSAGTGGSVFGVSNRPATYVRGHDAQLRVCRKTSTSRRGSRRAPRTPRKPLLIAKRDSMPSREEEVAGLPQHPAVSDVGCHGSRDAIVGRPRRVAVARAACVTRPSASAPTSTSSSVVTTRSAPAIRRSPSSPSAGDRRSRTMPPALAACTPAGASSTTRQLDGATASSLGGQEEEVRMRLPADSVPCRTRSLRTPRAASPSARRLRTGYWPSRRWRSARTTRRPTGIPRARSAVTSVARRETP